MAGRRTSLVSLAGAKVDDVPGRSDPVLLQVPLDKLHCTRFNPRRNFGTEEELREFGEKLQKEQLQPAVVVSRAAYLRLWPEEAERVGLASYVIANGERRYRASQLVGRPILEVVHREEVAKSRASFLDAVQSENNDRVNLDPIERAIAIETMVTELGGADQVAAYYEKTKGWVSQQRKLLKLTPELQDLVSAGEMPVRVARDIAGLPAEVQEVAWEEELAKRKAAKEAANRWKADGAPKPRPEAEAAPAPRFTAVNQTAPQAGFTAVKQEPAPQLSPAAAQEPVTQAQQAHVATAAPGLAQVPAERGEHIPEPREATQPEVPLAPPQPKRFPYDNGAEAAHYLLHRMDDDAFAAMMPLLLERWQRMQASTSS
ncbi:hypothetical protein [Streptomyces sp. NPDC003395]